MTTGYRIVRWWRGRHSGQVLEVMKQRYSLAEEAIATAWRISQKENRRVTVEQATGGSSSGTQTSDGSRMRIWDSDRGAVPTREQVPAAEQAVEQATEEQTTGEMPTAEATIAEEQAIEDIQTGDGESQPQV